MKRQVNSRQLNSMRYGALRRLRSLLFFLFVSLVSAREAVALTLAENLKKLVRAEAGAQVGVVVLDGQSGDELLSLNGLQSLKPASVLKLLTAGAAFDQLGAEFRFETEFVVSKAGDLVIVGVGDPTIVEEHLWRAARELRHRGLKTVRNIVLVARPGQPPVKEREGGRAYLASVGPFILNYNSVAIHVCAAERAGDAARVLVEPREASLAPRGTVRTVAGGGELNVGEVQGRSVAVGGAVRRGSECTVVYRSIDDPEEYFGSVLRGFLATEGISVTGRVVSSPSLPSEEPLYVHRSEDLGVVLRLMNEFSNNIVAEGLRRALDVHDGIDALSRYARTLDASGSQAIIVDGAGLSHANRVTPRLIAQALWRGSRALDWGAEFEVSLAIAGERGTLKKRSLAGGRVRGKTGSLDGVSSLAILTRSRTGRPLVVVVISNGIARKADAVDLEDRLVHEIVEGL